MDSESEDNSGVMDDEIAYNEMLDNTRAKSKGKTGRDSTDVVINQWKFPRAVFCRGMCREDPITESGKRRQMAKTLTLILTPIIVLLCVSFYFVSDNVSAKSVSDKVRNTILFSVEVGKLVHVMQKERDMSVLYLSSIGPETKTFLTERYLETDEQLAALPAWPADLDVYERKHFISRRSFQNYLTIHRNELELLNQTLYDEILFYSDSIKVFVRWLYDSIIESEYGTTWKNLVAYQKVVLAKEDVGVERALGSAYFSLGGFVSQTIYEWYNEKLHVYLAHIRSAVRYSPLVKPITEARISSGGKNLTDTVDSFRDTIQKRKLSKPSLKIATWYFDNMTIYIDLLFLVQRDLAKAIVMTLEERSADVTTGVVVSSIIILIVVIMCPVLIRTVRSLTNDIQSYALTLVDKTKSLNREKRRRDALLFQMLPEHATAEFKKGRDIFAEFIKECSVLFSSIVNFPDSTLNCSPSQIATILNRIYSLIDEKIEQHDVYKVDAIADTYMVVSGLVRVRGLRHAGEIANLAVGMLDMCSNANIPEISDMSLDIRIGIHSGPVVGGVVGVTIPRYCLFGDTIQIASSMEKTGDVGRAHISAATYRLLAQSGMYEMSVRGPMDVRTWNSIKGKGKTITYWLTGRGIEEEEEDEAMNDHAYWDMSH